MRRNSFQVAVPVMIDAVAAVNSPRLASGALQPKDGSLHSQALPGRFPGDASALLSAPPLFFVMFEALCPGTGHRKADGTEC